MATRAETIASAPVVTGRRTAQRARLQLAAILEGTTRNYRVLMRNLSSTGAMLQGLELPALGRMVALKRPGLDLLGTIVWRDGDHCGIHFDEPIETQRVIELARSAPEAPPSGSERCYQLPGVEEQVPSASEWASAKARAARELRSFS